MTGGYKAAKTGAGMTAGYMIWDCDNDFYHGGVKATVYATFEDAAKAARVQEMRDAVTRQRAGTGRGPVDTGRRYKR